MKNHQTQLSESLDLTIELLQDFQKTQDDYKKPLIRAELTKISNLSKVIGGTTLNKAQILIDDIDKMLNFSNYNLAPIIMEAVDLKNNLWQL